MPKNIGKLLALLTFSLAFPLLSPEVAWAANLGNCLGKDNVQTESLLQSVVLSDRFDSDSRGGRRGRHGGDR